MSWSRWLLGPWPGDLLPEAGCPDKGVRGEVGSAAAIVPQHPQVRTQSCCQCLFFPPGLRFRVSLSTWHVLKLSFRGRHGRKLGVSRGRICGAPRPLAG